VPIPAYQFPIEVDSGVAVKFPSLSHSLPFAFAHTKPTFERQSRFSTNQIGSVFRSGDFGAKEGAAGTEETWMKPGRTRPNIQAAAR
jgi:hypothetical protein